MSYIFRSGNNVYGGNRYVFGANDKNTFITASRIINLGKIPNGIAVDPVATNDRYLVGYTDGTIDSFKISDNSKIATYTGYGGTITSISFPPGDASKIVITILETSAIKVLNATTLATLNTYTLSPNPLDLKFINSSSALITFNNGNHGGFCSSYSYPSFILQKQYPANSNLLSCVFDPVFSRNRILVSNDGTGASIAIEGVLTSLNSIDGSFNKRLVPGGSLYGVFSCLFYSPDADIYCGLSNQNLVIFNNTTDECLYKLAVLNGKKGCFNPSGNRIYFTTTDNNGTINIADITYV